MKNSLLQIKLNYNEYEANKVQILNQNGDKQGQNTYVEVNIFARQKSKVRNSEVKWSEVKSLFIEGSSK